MGDPMNHQPAIGDKLWDEARKNNGQQPNGKITNIDWDSQVVFVTWQDNSGAWTEYDMDHIKDEYVNETMGYLLKDYQQGSII